MEIILALDPGSSQTAYCTFLVPNREIVDKGIVENKEIRGLIMDAFNGRGSCLLAIEFINYGVNVGREIFETVYWCGRWCEFAETRGFQVKRIARQKVKSFLTGKSTCNDSIVRSALLQKYGGTKKGEPLHGVVKDIWSALAVADYVNEAIKVGNLEEW